MIIPSDTAESRRPGARTRTPTQLQRKRTLDKASQKRKRDQQKSYVLQLEQDLRDAREQIERLRGIIRARSEPGQGAEAATSIRPGAPGPGASERDAASPPIIETGVIQGAYRGSSPTPEHKQRPIECYCKPKTHKSYSECFERTVFDKLISLHRQPTSPPPIPATPRVGDILFLADPGNPVAEILYKLMRRANMNNTVVLSAVYIIAHRILRYRFYPSVETYDDVPAWLRTTDIQDGIPHALYIDFVQFPRLRNAMTLGQVSIDSAREQFDADFGRHVSVNWPASRHFLVLDDARNTVLHRDFERHVCTEENWSLDSHFARKYPDIAPLVRIRD